MYGYKQLELALFVMVKPSLYPTHHCVYDFSQ